MKFKLLVISISLCIAGHAQIFDSTSLRHYINSNILPNSARTITATQLSNIENGHLNVLSAAVGGKIDKTDSNRLYVTPKQLRDSLLSKGGVKKISANANNGISATISNDTAQPVINITVDTSTASNGLSRKSYTDNTALLRVRKINTIADLLNYSGSNNEQAKVAGYYRPGDGGGGDFFWDDTATAAADSGTIFKATPTTGRWKRIYLTSQPIAAKWFGVTFDGVTDDTRRLQAAIDFCTSLAGKAITLQLPQGAAVTTSQLTIGQTGVANVAQASFCIRGMGMNAAGSSAGGGTVILYKGPSGPGTVIMDLKTSPTLYLSFERFNLSANVLDGVDVAFNFESSSHSFFKFDEVRFFAASTSVKLNVGVGLNGEFCEFHRCRFESFTKDGYYHDAPQAFGIKFFNCGFVPKAGATVWNFVAGSGGQFVGNDISFPGTGSLASPSTIIKVGNSNDDPIQFVGGRWEGTDQLVKFNSDLTGESVSFTGIEIGVNRNNLLIPGIDFGSSATTGSGKVFIDNCSINVSSGLVLQQPWTVVFGSAKNIDFQVSNTRFINSKLAVSGSYETLNGLQPSSFQSINNSHVEARNCIETFNSGTAVTTTRLDKVFVDNTAPVSYRQENLLLQSKYGEATGSSITAPSPWVHSGSSSFVSASNLAGSNPAVYSPYGKQIQIAPISGVYQDISAINITSTYANVVIYKADLSIHGNSQFRIAFVNSSTGKVYDQQVYRGTNTTGYRIHSVKLNAFVPVGDAGNIRLVQENLDSTNAVVVDIYQQLVSLNYDAAFVPTTTAAISKTQSYDNVASSLKVLNRLQVPYKADVYGYLASMPEQEAEAYLSADSLTFRLFTDRWETYPRQDRGAAAPLTGTWPTGFIRWNTSPATGQPIGFICAAGGSPGTWYPFATVNSNTWIRAGNYLYPSSVNDSIAVGATTPTAKFDLSGTGSALFRNSVTAASGAARGTYITSSMTAAANGDQLVSLDFNPTFNVGAFTSVGKLDLRSVNGIGVDRTSGAYYFSAGSAGLKSKIYSNASNDIVFTTLNTDLLHLYNGTGSIVIQKGGTFNDNGIDRLQVSGTSSFSDTVKASGIVRYTSNFSSRFDSLTLVHKKYVDSVQALKANTPTYYSNNATIDVSFSKNLAYTANTVTLALPAGSYNGKEVVIRNTATASGVITVTGAVSGEPAVVNFGHSITYSYFNGGWYAISQL